MNDVIKLTSVTGNPVYIRNAFNVNAVISERDGDLQYTAIHMLGFGVRVKQSAEEVAKLLGWEPKQIEAAREG